MELVKCSMHSGRNGSPSHNDRSMEDHVKDGHIDLSRANENIILSYNGENFADSERTFYRERYSAWIEDRNARALKAGHKERVMSTDDLLKMDHYKPIEIVLQVGHRGQDIDKEKFQACVEDYINELMKHDKNCHILNVAIHNDEATPHAHLRTVWDYTNSHGFIQIGTTGALREMGVPCPDESMPDTLRYNNRKITFDRDMREKWQNICESHGFNVDRTISKQEQLSHLQKGEFTLGNQDILLQEMQEEIQRQQRELELLEKDMREREEEYKRQNGVAQTALFIMENGLKDLIGVLDEYNELQLQQDR